MSGDEFAILLEEIGDVQRALEVADRILERVAEPVDIGRDVSVTASIGVVLVDDNVDDADDVLARADVAMYAAKAAGKGRHQLYEPAMRDRAWTPPRARRRAPAGHRQGPDRRGLPADPRPSDA